MTSSLWNRNVVWSLGVNVQKNSKKHFALVGSFTGWSMQIHEQGEERERVARAGAGVIFFISEDEKEKEKLLED